MGLEGGLEANRPNTLLAELKTVYTNTSYPAADHTRLKEAYNDILSITVRAKKETPALFPVLMKYAKPCQTAITSVNASPSANEIKMMQARLLGILEQILNEGEVALAVGDRATGASANSPIVTVPPKSAASTTGFSGASSPGADDLVTSIRQEVAKLQVQLAEEQARTRRAVTMLASYEKELNSAKTDLEVLKAQRTAERERLQKGTEPARAFTGNQGQNQPQNQVEIFSKERVQEVIQKLEAQQAAVLKEKDQRIVEMKRQLQKVDMDRQQAIQMVTSAQQKIERLEQEAKTIKESNARLMGEMEKGGAELKDLRTAQEADRRSIETYQATIEKNKIETEALKARIRSDTEKGVINDDPAVLSAQLRALLPKFPADFAHFVEGLLDVSGRVQNGDIAALAGMVDRLDRYIYRAPDAPGILANRGVADVNPALLVVRLQRCLHERLVKLGLQLISPSSGDVVDTKLHSCQESDLIVTHSDPALDGHIHSLIRVGFYNANTQTVIRKAQIRSYLYLEK